MIKMEEEKAVAILMANLGVSRNKPSKMSDMSLACRTLKLHPDWGMAKMIDFFGVTKTVLQELDRIHDLEPEFKEMVDQKHFGISAAYQLTRVDKPKRPEAAKLFQSMTRDEVRDLVFYITKYPNISVKEAKKRADDLKPKKINILALPLNDTVMSKLIKNSNKKNQSLHDYAAEILGKHG